jgi:hypothetical protein
MRRVAVVELGDRRVGVPFPDDGARVNRVLSLTLDGTSIVVFFDWRVPSLLDTQNYPDSARVGTAAAFLSRAAVETDVFTTAGDSSFSDEATHSVWNVMGRAVDGPLRGQQLEPVPITTGFWFAIAAAYPGIELSASGAEE